MKKIIVLLSMILAFSTMAFAADNAQNSVTLKGVIKFDGDRHYDLTAEGKTYELMVPWFLLRDVKDGTAIEVTGYKADQNNSFCRGYYAQKDKNQDLLFVTKFTINGKTTNVDDQRGKMMDRGPRGKMGRGWNR